MEKIAESPGESEHFDYSCPNNCYALWKRWTPEEHYRRLQDKDDEEARLHLLNLIICKLKIKYFESSVCLTGVTYSDLAHTIWAEIIEKMRVGGSLVMRQPNRFYGMVKLIIRNAVVDNYRKYGWRDIEHIGDICASRSAGSDGKNTVSEDQLLEMRSYDDIERDSHHRDILRLVQLALIKEAPMKALERHALLLAVLLKTGRSDIKGNDGIARTLCAETGKDITCEMAGAFIYRGMKALKKYLEEKGIDYRCVIRPGNGKK